MAKTLEIRTFAGCVGNSTCRLAISRRSAIYSEKDAALTQLGAFQKSLKGGLGKEVSPLQLNKIKQTVGNRGNGGGNVSVTDEVKAAYRNVYATMNKLISGAVPESQRAE